MKREELEKVLSLGKKISFKKDDVVFNEGSFSKEICYVLKGKVGVEKQLDSGDYIHILTISQEDFFGEMALFEEGKRLTQIKSLSDSEIIFIDREKFLSYLNREPEQGLKIFISMMKTILRRMGHTNKEMSCFYQVSLLLTKAKDTKELIESIAKVISHTFSFEGVTAYFFDNVSGVFEPLYKEGVETEKISLSLNLAGEIKEVAAKEFGVTKFDSALTLPLESSYGLSGVIIFFKQCPFSDNERIFLKAILPQINSFLESFFSKREEYHRKKLKQIRYQF